MVHTFSIRICAQARAPAVQSHVQHRTGMSVLCHMNTAKKLRYMSKFVSIFSTSDNTQLMRTQPIANPLNTSLQIFPALLLTFLSPCKFLSDMAIVLFRY